MGTAEEDTFSSLRRALVMSDDRSAEDAALQGILRDLYKLDEEKDELGKTVAKATAAAAKAAAKKQQGAGGGGGGEAVAEGAEVAETDPLDAAAAAAAAEEEAHEAERLAKVRTVFFLLWF